MGPGRWRRYLRRLLWLELRAGRRRILGPCHCHSRHGNHVYHHDVQPGRTFHSSPPCRRPLFIRSPNHGPLGRLSHRPSCGHRIRDYPSSHSCGYRRLSPRHLALGAPVGLVGGCLRHLRRNQHLGRGINLEGLPGGHHRRHPGALHFLYCRTPFRRMELGQTLQH